MKEKRPAGRKVYGTVGRKVSTMEPHSAASTDKYLADKWADQKAYQWGKEWVIRWVVY